MDLLWGVSPRASSRFRLLSVLDISFAILTQLGWKTHDATGGLSHFSGHVGLVCDNVLEYEVVLASGLIVRATASDPEYSDLFYALKGGSNNFGIVTRFTFRTFRQGHLWGGTLIHPIETNTQQLHAFYDFCGESYDPNASLIHSFGMSSERGSGFVNSIVYTEPEHEPAVVKPFTKIQPIYQNTLRELSLTTLTREQDAFNENGLWLFAQTTFCKPARC